MKKNLTVYLGVSADIFHHGHINIIKKSLKYGNLIIGLLTDKVKPLYDKLGVLEYQDWPTDGEIDWASLERPLDKTEEVEQGQFMSV